jgi:hypothetical protein
MSDPVIRKRPRTTKAFTLVVQCVDPPIPALVFNTNREREARKEYELCAKELLDKAGGEASITLYQHTGASKRTEYATTDDEYGHYTYAVHYEGSIVLSETNWMDVAS